MEANWPIWRTTGSICILAYAVSDGVVENSDGLSMVSNDQVNALLSAVTRRGASCSLSWGEVADDMSFRFCVERAAGLSIIRPYGTWTPS